jgi:hypothetical protein
MGQVYYECMKKLDWVKNGEMDGKDKSIMRSLYYFLPAKDLISAREFGSFEIAQRYMAELWLRGVSKEDFQKWVENEILPNA